MDLPPPRTAPACPRCAASVRAGAPWCTQCYLDLRVGHLDLRVADAPAAPVREPLPQAASDSAAEPLPAASDRPRATWPCTACGAATELSADACEGCGAPFLGDLRTGGDGLALPVLGVVRPGDRARVLALACGAVLLLCLAVLALGLVTG